MSALYVEKFENQTQELVEALRKAFDERVASSNPEFCREDLARAKTDDLWLKRFLADKENDVKLATQMLYETCQWRKEFGTNDLDHTSLIPEVLEKGVLFIRNTDKWGKKLLVFKAKFHSKGVHNMEEVKKFIVYYFDRIEREAKSEQISVIFDMKDTGWNNMDMDFIRYLITLLKSYYPYFVNFLMIYEMPWLLKSAWNIIKGWLPAKFVDRVKFVDKKTIGEFIDIDNQLEAWGGNDDYKYKFIPENRNNNSVSSSISTSAKPEMKDQRSVQSLDDPDLPPVLVNGHGKTKTPPEVKPRHSKVKLTGADGGVDTTRINITSIESDPPPPEAALSSPRVSTNQLAEVDDTITFTSTPSGIMATFHVRNLNIETIIIKVKTTAPEKYRVRPTIGLIEGGARAPINVFVHDGVPIYTLPHDRFQVQVSLVPPGFQLDNAETDSGTGAGSHSINFGDLQTQWKNITGTGAGLETHRLTCRVDPRITPSPLPHSPTPRNEAGGVVTMNEDDMRRGLSQLEQKMTATIMAGLDERFKYLEHLLYAIFFLVGMVGIILYFSMPSTVPLPDNICTMKEHNLPLGGKGTFGGSLPPPVEGNCGSGGVGCNEL